LAAGAEARCPELLRTMSSAVKACATTKQKENAAIMTRFICTLSTFGEYQTFLYSSINCFRFARQ
jgi:hypothetical protein